LFQDRLIKEMRLAQVKDYDEANKFLVERFLPWYNQRYTHPAESAYIPLPKEKNLDLIFCVKTQRTVNNDNTITFKGQIIQIPPSDKKLSFAKRKVDVCLLEYNRITVFYEDKIVARSILSEDNRIFTEEKTIEEILNKRQYTSLQTRRKPKPTYIPPVNHPWRRAVAEEVRLKQMNLSRNEIKAQKEIERLFGGLVSFVSR
jgi:hypothetical protein